MNSQSQDILAKLLATENLTVSRGPVHTASFDIKNRVLTLPMWKHLTPVVEEMLILHEVGHALYTTVDGYGVLHETARHLLPYANIIEDVRIEKKMKDRYPGSRKSFNAGYTELNEKDFFGIKDRDFSELLLIDKINLFYKVGYNAGVPFTAEEYVFVQKTDKCVTEQDVIDLAEEIWEYSKQQYEEEQEEELRAVRGEAGGGSEFELTPEELEELMPETTEAFEEALGRHKDLESRTFYFDAKFEIEDTEDVIVSHKKVLQEFNEVFSSDIDALRLKTKSAKFKTESNNIINYLVKEFEMRKSASAYKRTKISKLGQLDSRKLFAYKLKDDIFKQMTTVMEGKKHGMIFLLDWSGSMQTYMEETVEQVINLAMFCQKIKIPYQVLAFTDGYERREHFIDAKYKKNPNGIDDMRGFSLLELFTDAMTIRDFNRMIECLLDCPWNRIRKYGLNGTPLNQSLLYMAEYIGKFIRKDNIEKMNLITLTDGESNELHDINSGTRNYHGIKSGKTYISEHGKYVQVNATTILRDTVTRKEYVITPRAGHQTGVLMQLLRDRYKLRSIGFYVTSNNVRHHERFVRHNIEYEMPESKRKTLAIGIHQSLRRDKAAVLKTVPGRDELYIISSNQKIIDEELENVNQDMTAAQISKALGNMFTVRKTSRVVLNSFVGVVA